MSSSGCNKLIEYYKKVIGNEQPCGFYSSIQEKDLDKRTEINDFICAEIEHSLKLKKIISSFTPLFGNFLIKKANSNHNIGIHQDWSCVDEKNVRSFNVWVSLIDTNKENGGLSVMPKSHLLDFPIRYSPIDTDYLKPFYFLIRLKSISLQLKKGEALIYDSALIHYSDSNKSNNIRYACGCVCIHPNATPLHYHKEGKSLLEYEVDRYFFNSFIQRNKPNLPYKRMLPMPRLSKMKTWVSLMKL